jgi:hypothetical protein
MPIFAMTRRLFRRVDNQQSHSIATIFATSKSGVPRRQMPISQREYAQQELKSDVADFLMVGHLQKGAKL